MKKTIKVMFWNNRSDLDPIVTGKRFYQGDNNTAVLQFLGMDLGSITDHDYTAILQMQPQDGTESLFREEIPITTNPFEYTLPTVDPNVMSHVGPVDCFLTIKEGDRQTVAGNFNFKIASDGSDQALKEVDLADYDSIVIKLEDYLKKFDGLDFNDQIQDADTLTTIQKIAKGSA